MKTSVTPVRLQLSRKKGFRLVSPNGLPVAIVDRRTKWGNPWPALQGHRDVAVELFRQELEREQAYESYGSDGQETVTVADIQRELKGKNLACWCPLFDENGVPAPCHADVLLQIAQEGPL